MMRGVEEDMVDFMSTILDSKPGQLDKDKPLRRQRCQGRYLVFHLFPFLKVSHDKDHVNVHIVRDETPIPVQAKQSSP